MISRAVALLLFGGEVFAQDGAPAREIVWLGAV
jgi:hypothetical protein